MKKKTENPKALPDVKKVLSKKMIKNLKEAYAVSEELDRHSDPDNIVEPVKAAVKRELPTEPEKDQDSAGAGIRPNFRKYLKEKINMKIEVTSKLSKELQKICFEEGVGWKTVKEMKFAVYPGAVPFLFIVNHSDSGYSIGYHTKSSYFKKQNRGSEALEYDPEKDIIKRVKTKLTDRKASSAKATLLETTPEPLKINLPDIFFCPMPDRMEVFYKSRITDFACFRISPDGRVLYSEETTACYACYNTLKEAVLVGEKKWWRA